MLNNDDFMHAVATALGIIGRALVYIGMGCGALLLWYLIIMSCC